MAAVGLAALAGVVAPAGALVAEVAGADGAAGPHAARSARPPDNRKVLRRS